MDPKENYLEAVRFGRPEYVPMDCEPVWYGFQFEGNFRGADWTDSWGVDWRVGLEGTVPFPKGNPLSDLEAAEVIQNPVDCNPCFLRECPIDFRCMNGISVEQVLSAAERKLERRLGERSKSGR
jgi:hypothetical protein